MTQRISLWIKDKWGFLWQILQQIHHSSEPVSGIILTILFGVNGRLLEGVYPHNRNMKPPAGTKNQIPADMIFGAQNL